jgi:Glycosyl transferase family 2
MIGFHSFLIMNDASTDDTQCVLDAYAKQGVVVRIPQDLHGELRIQAKNQGDVFDACVEYLAQKLNPRELASTWLLTHDVDEFVWFNNKTAGSLNEAIQILRAQHENAQSMRIPRLLFGSSGHDDYEPVPVMERYTYRYDAGSCPPSKKKLQQEQQLHRRRLFNQQRPTSYCDAHEKSLYDNHKSMTVMSAIARDCWDTMDPISNEQRVARCTGPHNHELKNPSGGPTKLSKSAATDPRYLDALDILDTVAIMHYMTRSRQEFYQRVCGSQFARKYFKCSGCTPETYFNLTETYANLLQDTRMHFMAQKLQVTLSAKRDESPSTSVSTCDELLPHSSLPGGKCW